jgi:anaerobic magnesium-protoporphyrin IX monomethyl ester cyclase
VKVLVMEPPNQLLPRDTARPNGALGPAYLVGALRAAGVEADYYDGTVGWLGEPLGSTFYNRQIQDNGLVRYGASKKQIAEVVSHYDVVATSSIFTAQTRMHFEVAEIVKWVASGSHPMGTVSGGVNASALKSEFLQHGFDIVIDGDGEQALVDVMRMLKGQVPNSIESKLDYLPLPALGALPLETYRRLGIPHAGVLPKGKKFASIQTSRGCQDSCSFCHISMEKQHGSGFLRTFSVERVSQMVDQAVSLGVERLYFEDDNLFFSKKRLVGLAKVLKRPGLEYSNVNGGNLRFLFKRYGEQCEVDEEFIALLADFGLVELTLPFESRSVGIMNKYATSKYNPERYDSAELVTALKTAGIRTQGNFMIGFPDETWESVLATKQYALEMREAGLDAVGFMIPVPYPGSLDFERVMQQPGMREQFDADPLAFTDRMHWRAKPLFKTAVDGARLEAAVKEWWEELNGTVYVTEKSAKNVEALQ